VEIKLPSNIKTPLDYVEDRGELVPVQVRLPKELVDGVKAKLQKHGMTFTELIRGACHWYLEYPEATIVEKTKNIRQRQ
jgi:predicted DNA binding CopG/RHH family protein